eukprot:TRINITY_DN2587_c0_g1_i5.p2 TRINITY_DN2587_c0_g1~~TRINITY_DN2587_c0_g1_i5.p2  ORF type:complete len:324 (-),score=17.97 TRINITY_DN2587_c0_g1_i5:235-1206(-)
MKYAKVMSSVKDEYNRESFTLTFLEYKALKKLLKDRETSEPFFALLGKNIKEIQRDFKKLSSRVLLEYERKNRCMSWLPSFIPIVSNEKMCQRAFQCLRYAHVNTVGLRKILKKHDKELQQTTGRLFLQSIWENNRRDNFLHSPVLWEIAAIYKNGDFFNVQAPHQTGDQFWQEVPGIKEDLQIDDRMRTLSITYIDELQWTCPICLGLLYHPVGLGCGHKFCADCVSAALNNGQISSKPLWFLKSLSEQQRCPECRQKGVFKHLLQLKILNKVLQRKFPKDYQERQQTTRLERQEQIKKQVQINLQQWGCHTFHPHALILSM